MKKHKKLSALLAVTILGSNTLVPSVLAVELKTSDTSEEQKIKNETTILKNEQPLESTGFSEDTQEFFEEISETEETDVVEGLETSEGTLFESESTIEENQTSETLAAQENDTEEDSQEDDEEETDLNLLVRATRAGDVEVGTWPELKKALETPGTERVIITKNITGTATPITINTGNDVVIEGNAKILSQGKAAAQLIAGDVTSVTLKDLTINGASRGKPFITASVESSLKDVIITGVSTLNFYQRYETSFINLPEGKGTVSFDKGTVTGFTTSAIPAITADKLVIDHVFMENISLKSSLFKGKDVEIRNNAKFNVGATMTTVPVFDMTGDFKATESNLTLNTAKGGLISNATSTSFDKCDVSFELTGSQTFIKSKDFDFKGSDFVIVGMNGTFLEGDTATIDIPDNEMKIMAGELNSTPQNIFQLTDSAIVNASKLTLDSTSRGYFVEAEKNFTLDIKEVVVNTKGGFYKGATLTPKWKVLNFTGGHYTGGTRPESIAMIDSPNTELVFTTEEVTIVANGPFFKGKSVTLNGASDMAIDSQYVSSTGYGKDSGKGIFELTENFESVDSNIEATVKSPLVKAENVSITSGNHILSGGSSSTSAWYWMFEAYDNMVIKNAVFSASTKQGVLRAKNTEVIDSQFTLNTGEGSDSSTGIFFTSGEMVFKNSVVDGNIPKSYLLRGKDFIIDSSKLDLTLGALYYQESEEPSKVVVNNKSNLTIIGEESSHPIMRYETAQGTLDIDGAETVVNIKGLNTSYNEQAGKEGNSGLIRLDKDNAVINVSNGAILDIHALKNAAIAMESEFGQFNVTGKSTLNLVSDDTSKNSEVQIPVLRFIQKGSATFNIEDHSKMSILKKTGTGPGIRMFGPNNEVNVSGGSDFEIKHEGEGSGVHYPDGKGNKFTLKDEDSAVNIDSKKSHAILFQGGIGEVEAGRGTFFTLRGNEKLGAVYSRAGLIFKMEALKYFDFKNTADGPAISTYTGTSPKTNNIFTSSESDFSVWKRGSNIEKSPTHSYDMLDFEAKGQYYEKITSPDASFIEDVKADNNGLDSYSRMTANNQKAKLSEIRVPTDADSYIYARATVPQAKGEPDRAAYKDEVTAKAKLMDKDGAEIAVLEAKTEDNDFEVYHEPAEGGVLQFKLPEGQKYLEKGQKVEFVSGFAGDPNLKPKEIPEENINRDREVVQDVTPPEQIEVNNQDRVSALGKSVTGALSEPGFVTLYGYDKTTNEPKGTPQTAKTEDAPNEEGKYAYSVPMVEGLEEDDILYVAGKDQAGKVIPSVINPPNTNDEQGNETPHQKLHEIEGIDPYQYHDRIFTQAVRLVLIGGDISFEVPKELDFHDNKVDVKEQQIKPDHTGRLAVVDTRGRGKMNWQLALKVATPLKNGDIDLTSGLSYTNSENNKQSLAGNTDITIEHSNEGDTDERDFSKEWSNSEQGFELKVPVEKQIVGNYSGSFVWTLKDGVENKEVD